MTFDFDKELDTIIATVTTSEKEKLAFSLGYNAGHTAATKISYTPRAAIVVDMIEKYAEQNGRSFVIGYLLGMAETHMKIMNYDSDPGDDEERATDDNNAELGTDTNYEIKRMQPVRTQGLGNMDTA